MRRFLSLLLLGACLSAQMMLPTLDNRVAELRVTELSQTGDRLKVTVQNRSARTIRAMTMTMGRHKVEQDWSLRPGGGLGPNEVASVVISTAGVRAGGTRHHPEPPGPLALFGAVFADGGAAAPPVEKPVVVVKPVPPPATDTTDARSCSGESDRCGPVEAAAE